MIRSARKTKELGRRSPGVRGVTPGLALVFDLDGVIVHSNPVHRISWREYLRRCGIEAPEGFEERMYGRHNNDIVRALMGDRLDAAVVARHGEEKERLYRELMRPVLHKYLVPGLVGFLEAHQTAPMAVATNGERANADFVLETGAIRKYFRVVVDGQQVERPKPDPEIYVRTAELLGVHPMNCVVFEDSLAGVEAARAAGARVVGLRTTHDELPSVDLSVRDFLDAELEPWLADQKPLP